MKLIFLLIIPGILAEFISEDIREKGKANFGKSIIHSLFYSYIIFLTDITVINGCFNRQYKDFLAFLNRTIETVEDVFLLFLLLFVQLFAAFGVGMLSRIIRHKCVERAVRFMTALQKNVVVAALGLSFLITMGNFILKDSAERQLVVNEICSRNDKVLQDENGNYSDYVELYNSSKWNILLKNFQISDNSDLKDGVTLGEVIIPAKGYCIVWIDSESVGGSDFGISSGGENVYLATPGGEIVDSVAVPGLDANTVYARATDGADEWKVEAPTPLAANDALKKLLEKPVFSVESGFYEEEFQLHIQAEEGQRIYYTLDSSIPDENAILYTDGITVKNISDTPNRYSDIPNVETEWNTEAQPGDPVDKAFVVRAMAVDEYGNTSEVVTKTYFVGMEEYRKGYLLSLVSDPEDLFGDNGIYVTGKAYDDWYLGKTDGYEPTPNFELRGRESEIEASVTLFDDVLLMEQQGGIRIQGASQRNMPLKRFSVFARKEYSGSRYFDYELFGEQMHSFFLRPDFEDAFIHTLVTDRNVGTLKAVPATVFLNGEWWYDTYLREKYSEDFLAFTYGVSRKEVRLEEGVPAEIYSFLEKHDLSKQEDFQQFCDMIDLQSYIDHLATNIYMCNMDACEYKNYRIWKTQNPTGEGYNDGRWRWLIYDTDAIKWNSIGYYGAARYDIDSFAHDKEYAGVAYNQERVYKALRVNEEFCRQFVLTFMDLANNNFAVETIAEKIIAWGEDMSWNDDFFQKRFEGIVPALAKEFELQGTLEEIQLSVNDTEAGYVTINTTTPILREGSWKGRYYTDYPVTITAIPNEGYEFVGWKNSGTIIEEMQLTVQLEAGGGQWEAVFEKKK